MTTAQTTLMTSSGSNSLNALHSAAIYHPTDDLFQAPSPHYPATMKTRGQAITVEQANAAVEGVLKRFQLTKQQLHGSQLVHGANSGSLLAFTDYNSQRGDLVPSSILAQRQLVAFSGEHCLGSFGINRSCLSTTWIGELDEAIEYTKTPPFKMMPKREVDVSTETTDQMLSKYSPGSFFARIAELNNRVTKARQQAWPSLTHIERQLVSTGFPIVYGISCPRKNAHHMVESDVSGEVGLEGGAKKDEIKVIFVLPEWRDFVRALLEEYNHTIPVEPFPHFRLGR